MALSNAERQARHKQRLRELAAQAALMTPAQAEFLKMLRRRNIVTRERIELFRSGKLSLHALGPDGHRDISEEAIARDEAEVAENERLLALHDPEETTA